ncbi:MAG: prepilin-type N-terminal cleavage/methylation domain-containing protein [Firmicutes bacterium]|nr:prepilin-type N-terminal cleavage/methylation domain-containing protein [Bacillota bacterium]
MKKKGFTLIELLAVIVVLAIIALIATPIVMNVISNAQKGAAERSADNYVKAVETLIATERLDGEPVEDGTYTIDENGNIKSGDVELTVELNGTKPNGGSIEIKDGQVVKNESSIKVGDYTVTFEDGKAEAKELAKLLDVCQLTDGEENEVGAEYNCNLGDGDRTFYVLEAGTSSKPATLILEGNYDTTTQSWCDQNGDYPNNSLLCQADGLAAKLDEIALAWTKLDRSQIGIPSAEQIMVADGQAEDAYIDYPMLNNEWLWSWDNEAWGNSVNGYWTSTPVEGDSYSIWLVYDDGSVNNDFVDTDFGVRPVLMLSI